jgi:RNA polymerase sigma-54 factor
VGYNTFYQKYIHAAPFNNEKPSELQLWVKANALYDISNELHVGLDLHGNTASYSFDTFDTYNSLTFTPHFDITNKQVDLRVERKGGRFEVECTQDSWKKVKRLHVNKLYADMLTDGSKLDKETREYILNNKRKAEEFISAANNRFSTMELVMRAIVKRQPAFFKNGPAFLKPMVLQDIASEVKRDLSTISRVTNGKYVETPFGIFELKDFFTSGVRQQGKRAVVQPAAEDAPLGPAVNAGEEGDEDVVGSARILEAIKDLVDGENKKKPLSDQAIADALAAQGIQVARRTVAKYREERLKILPARQRKLL